MFKKVPAFLKLLGQLGISVVMLALAYNNTARIYGRLRIGEPTLAALLLALSIWFMRRKNGRSSSLFRRLVGVTTVRHSSTCSVEIHTRRHIACGDGHLFLLLAAGVVVSLVRSARKTFNFPGSAE